MCVYHQNRALLGKASVGAVSHEPKAPVHADIPILSSSTLPTENVNGAHHIHDREQEAKNQVLLERLRLEAQRSVQSYQQDQAVTPHPCGQKERLKGEDRAQVTYLQIQRNHNEEPLNWVHITQPNTPTLLSVVKRFGIKLADLQHCLHGDEAPQSYRYRDYLVNRFTELSLDTKSKAGLTTNSICSILGSNYLITISEEPSRAVERVRSEVKEKRIEVGDVDSSNYLFCRIFGASLHLNERVIQGLERQSRTFREEERGKRPSTVLQEKMASLSNANFAAHRAIETCPEVLHSLSESVNLFGASKSRDALPRYQTIVNGMERRLLDANRALEMTRESWRIGQEELQNGILFKIGLLTGALAPSSVVMSFFGMNFADGLTFSTSAMFAAIAGSVAISGALIAGLFSWRKTTQPKNRSHRAVHESG